MKLIQFSQSTLILLMADMSKWGFFLDQTTIFQGSSPCCHSFPGGDIPVGLPVQWSLWSRDRLTQLTPAQLTKLIGPAMCRCWATIYDYGPALTRNWVSAPCCRPVWKGQEYRDCAMVRGNHWFGGSGPRRQHTQQTQDSQLICWFNAGPTSVDGGPSFNQHRLGFPRLLSSTDPLSGAPVGVGQLPILAQI